MIEYFDFEQKSFGSGLYRESISNDVGVDSKKLIR
jgi:hypothetical protein